MFKTTISVNQYAAYHSPLNFRDPEKFVPERWLPHSAEYAPYTEDKRAAFHPFSAGPRNCLGKNLAYHEMRIILARLIWGFDIEMVERTKGEDWLEQRVLLFWEKKPLFVKVREVIR